MDDVYQGHAALYDQISTGLDGDVTFYLEEAQRAGSPILELGTGTGRVLVTLAEAGLSVVGLDQAPAMLAVARQKVARLAPAVRGRIELVEGDMRGFSLGRRFRAILIPYRAFLHLLTPEDERRALACIREHLADNGRLILNIFDPRIDMIAAHLGPLGPALKRIGEYAYPSGRKLAVWESRQYDPGHQTVSEHRILEELDEEGRVVARRHSSLSLRYIYRYEMQYLLELSGFAVEALYGDFRRGPFRYGGEQIWIAHRRAADELASISTGKAAGEHAPAPAPHRAARNGDWLGV